jgi:transposase
MEEKGGSWRVNCMKWGITQQFTESYSPWQNHAEQTVLEMKKQIKHFMR